MKEVVLTADVPYLPTRILKTGELSCLYEAGNLRYIKYADAEIIRMIYGAVRDENWSTIPPVISDEVIRETNDGFTISYNADYKATGIHYRFSFLMEGYNNSISCFMKGETIAASKTNRVGLCVLHPVNECSGQAILIQTPDGKSYESVFPENVSPHQPFFNIRSMSWTTASGIKTTLDFEGDIFETEDQRNWSDHSYKTYSTPLEIPFPVVRDAGYTIEQSIRLHASTNKKAQPQIQPAIIEEEVPFPRIGFCKPEGSLKLTEEVRSLFVQIPFDHYQVTLDLNDKIWKEVLKIATGEAEILQTTLELVIFVDNNNQQTAEEIIAALQACSGRVSSMLLLEHNKDISSLSLLEKFIPTIKAKYPLIAFGYGTIGNFAELNRNMPAAKAYDFLHFSLQPQAHASDSRTIMENLDSQYEIISTIQTAGRIPVHISPVSLKGSKGPKDQPDEREHTHFGAFWKLMCMQNLADGMHITYKHLPLAFPVGGEIKKTRFYEMLVLIKAFNPVSIKRKFNNGILIMDGLLLVNEKGEQLNFHM